MRKSKIEVLQQFEDIFKRFLDIEENVIFNNLNHFYQDITLKYYTKDSRLRSVSCIFENIDKCEN